MSDSLHARAKINLSLHVTGRRNDGYHLLDSLTVFARDVYDVLTVRRADEFSLRVGGVFADALRGEDADQNLAARAARLWAEDTGEALPYYIHLDKNIPAGAGLGGGSADAAAAIKLLEGMTGKTLEGALRPLRLLTLGADVPVCDHGRACRFKSVGEAITDLPPLPPFYMLLVWPGAHSNTKDVFTARAAQNALFDAPMPATPAAFADFTDLLAFLRSAANGLTDAACSLNPVIRTAIDALAATKYCRLARMSGSGSCVFGLYEDELSARAASMEIGRDYPDWWRAVTTAM